MTPPESANPQGEQEPDWEQIADGLALWQEAKPQTIEDWQAIARRFSEGESAAQAEAARYREALERLLGWADAVANAYPNYDRDALESARAALASSSEGSSDG